MSDSGIEIDQGSAGIYVDSSQVSTGEGTVQRQRVAIADATAPENFLQVDSDGNAYAVVSGSVSVLNPSGGGASSVSVLNFPLTQNVIAAIASPLDGSGYVQVDVEAWNAGTLPVDVTNTVNVAGSVSVLNQSSSSSSVSVLNFPGVQSVAGSVAVTNFPTSFIVSSGSVSVVGQVAVTQATSPWVVSGSISVLNPSQTEIVSGSVNVVGAVNANVSGSVSVLNPVTAEIVSGSVSVTGAVNANVTNQVGVYQEGNWGASVSNFPAVQTVGGSVSVLNPVSAEIVSGSVSVTGAVNAAFVDYRPTAASITNYDPSTVASVGQNGSTYYTGSASTGSFVSAAINGEGDFRLLIGGTWTGTLQAEGSIDNGTTWTAITLEVSGTSYRVSQWTANGLGFGTVSGFTNVRVRALPSSWTGTTRITLTFSSEDGAVRIIGPVSLFDNVQGNQATITPGSSAASVSNTALVTALSPNTPLPSGTNALGSVIASGSVTAIPYGNQTVSGSVSVSGEVDVVQATSPWVVSGSVTTQGTVNANITSGSVGVTNFPGSFITSGSVTAIPYGTQGISGSVSVTNGYVEQQYLSASVLPTPTSPPTLVAGMSDKFGRQVVLPQGMRDIVGFQETVMTGSSASVVVTAIANTYTDISTIVLMNSTSSTLYPILSDGTNSFEFAVPSGDVRGVSFQVPLPATNINTSWTLSPNGTSANALVCNVVYIKNK